MLLYTTKEAIANRLRGRLTVGGPSLPFGPTTVDDNLIRQVGEQVEARVNAKLKGVYRLPLIGSHPVLTSAVEKLILCELLPVHSVEEEQSISSNQGVDRSYVGLVCRQGKAELEEILSGAIALEGESTLEVADGGAISNYSGVAQRLPIITRPDAGGIKW